MSPHLATIAHLRLALDTLRQDASTDRVFVSTARAQRSLFQALPPNYEKVWLDLVDRLESSALFTEESCSFSQTDLFDNLAMVLDKAHAQLNPPS